MSAMHILLMALVIGLFGCEPETRHRSVEFPQDVAIRPARHAGDHTVQDLGQSVQVKPDWAFDASQGLDQTNTSRLDEGFQRGDTGGGDDDAGLEYSSDSDIPDAYEDDVGRVDVDVMVGEDAGHPSLMPEHLCDEGQSGPGALEVCDGEDQDCDGAVDERCQTAMATLWKPHFELTAAGTCERWEVPADSDVVCDDNGLTLPPIELSEWFRLRQHNEAGAQMNGQHASINFEPVEHFRLTIRVNVLASDRPERPLDGSVFGFLGLRFLNEVAGAGFPGTMTGLLFMPGELPRFYYQGGPSSGAGYEEVIFGEPTELVIERLGHSLSTYANGELVGQAIVPAMDRVSRIDDPHLRLSGLFTACSHCRAHVESIRVEVPTVAPTEVERASCSNRVRNATFRHATDGVPDAWAIDYSHQRPGFCCEATDVDSLRATLQAIVSNDDVPGVRLTPTEEAIERPRLVQPVVLRGHEDVIEVSLDTRSDAGSEVEISLEGCGPTVRRPVRRGQARMNVHFVCDGVLAAELGFRNVGVGVFDVHRVMLVQEEDSEFCEDWREDIEPTRVREQRAVYALSPDPQRIPLDEFRVRAWYDQTGLSIQVGPVSSPFRVALSPHAVPEKPWYADNTSVQRGRWIPCERAGCIAGDRIWLIPFDEMDLTPATEIQWSLRISGVSRDESWASGIGLVWSRNVFQDHLRPPADFEPAGGHLWSQVRHLPLHPVRLGPAVRDIVNDSHFQLLGTLGLDGIGLVNPHPNLIPRFIQHALDMDNMTLDLQSFLVIPFWRDDAQRADYWRWVAAINDGLSRCAPECPTVLWNIVDEPGIHDLARCVTDLSTQTNRQDLMPPLDALSAALCDDGIVCGRSEAQLACDGAFPELLADLVRDLKSDLVDSVSVGLNLTGDRGQRYLSALNGRLDYSSYTNNWVGRYPPRSWPLIQLERRQREGDETPFIGYNVFGGPLGGWTIRRAPSAHAFRGMSVLLSAFGANGIRGFVWPPASLDVLEELGHEAEAFRALSHIVPSGRLSPRLPTSSPSVVATAFLRGRDLVIAVVNRTEQTVRAAIDVRGLPRRARAVDVFSGIETPIQSGRLSVVLAPFEGRFVRCLDEE